MEWQIDNNKPVYIQLVEQLKMKIISGEIELDSKLDSVRTLAAEAMVNPNTMQKALAELEREGFVYSKRTSGRFVTDNKELIEKERKNLVKENVKKTLDTLINLGYTNDEILSLVEEILREDNNE
ncbi:GntR family transcriptional regulator [Intestinibacter bartlettii]|uniref:GntR family transcriptional regulator n=1 Tax=Intestinibacter bartlettii TaxID=261299 RepID=A0ABS6DWA3_9FIRM|nr:GntR family transcriptional regulator [Intestinibacter bartlettii]MBU5336084.1 GntR family transcriptional regulator [Intestinibacter bartlettii]MDO5010266.1 GntR family transcriptional regulator [Intestinibacter bartlettii]